MTVTLSSKYQIVIPKEIRELLKLRPGQKLAFIPSGGSVKLVRVPELEEQWGIAKGSPPFERDRSDREF
jgi:AbrB family looped-hinge helix DNA binding protein